MQVLNSISFEYYVNFNLQMHCFSLQGDEECCYNVCLTGASQKQLDDVCGN